MCRSIDPTSACLSAGPFDQHAARRNNRRRSLSRRAPRLLDTGDIEQGTVTYMAECGIEQVGYQDAMEWRAPNEEETAYFSLPADGHVQVVEIRRVALNAIRDMLAW